MSSLQEILENTRQALIAASVPPPPPRPLTEWEKTQEARRIRKKASTIPTRTLSKNQKRERYVQWGKSDDGWKWAARPDVKMPWNKSSGGAA